MRLVEISIKMIDDIEPDLATRETYKSIKLDLQWKL